MKNAREKACAKSRTEKLQLLNLVQVVYYLLLFTVVAYCFCLHVCVYFDQGPMPSRMRYGFEKKKLSIEKPTRMSQMLSNRIECL